MTLQPVLRLITELGQLEVKRKVAALGKAAGIGALAGVFVFYAIGFLLAAAAAGLSETLALWLSLLIVGAALLLSILPAEPSDGDRPSRPEMCPA